MEIPMRRFIFAALAVSVFAACQPATTELTVVQEAEIAAEVMMVANELMSAWDDTFVKALSLNTAVFRGRYHGTLTDTEGVATMFRPHWTAIFERRVDGWKMTVIDHAYGKGEVVEGD